MASQAIYNPVTSRNYIIGFQTEDEALHHIRDGLQPDIDVVIVFMGQKQTIRGARLPKQLDFVIRPVAGGRPISVFLGLSRSCVAGMCPTRWC
ncbi:hypothetical protein RRG08_051594 [Elysia crispata]|uniref:Uncharacterized protein n=1 Tax=Elysia crispata TaxID=231223 RepID=A0AAE1A440_9GAST|nr:hypothetical protein RRG08_051594 [Elysia crispata]